jgi:hypothetical protein
MPRFNEKGENRHNNFCQGLTESREFGRQTPRAATRAIWIPCLKTSPWQAGFFALWKSAARLCDSDAAR